MQVARFRQVERFDRDGFGHAMVTRTCLVPEGSSVEGGARWRPQARIEDWVTEHFRATSPDGQRRDARRP